MRLWFLECCFWLDFGPHYWGAVSPWDFRSRFCMQILLLNCVVSNFAILLLETLLSDSELSKLNCISLFTALTPSRRASPTSPDNFSIHSAWSLRFWLERFNAAKTLSSHSSFKTAIYPFSCRSGSLVGLPIVGDLVASSYIQSILYSLVQSILWRWVEFRC